MPSRMYNFMDWYWLADDGRIFSSARKLIVDPDDAGYVAFCEAGPATPWPRDDAGQQTDASLQAVFDSYNIVTAGVPATPVVVSSKNRAVK